MAVPGHKNEEDRLTDGGLLWTLVSGANNKERGVGCGKGVLETKQAKPSSNCSILNLRPFSCIMSAKKLLFLEEHQHRTRSRRDMERNNRSFRTTIAPLRSGMAHMPRESQSDAGTSASDKDERLGSDRCVFQCLHTTSWGRAYESAHPSGSRVRDLLVDESIAAKSTRLVVLK